MGLNRVHTVFSKCFKIVPLVVAGTITVTSTTSAETSNTTSVLSPQRPLLFEQNQGQFNDSVDYVARGKGYSIILGQRPVIELYRYRSEAVPTSTEFDVPAQNRSVLEEIAKIRLTVVGARQDSKSIPLEKQQALTHYLTGDQSNWKTDVRNFKRVRYADVLDKIDIEYYGRDGRLEYDFVVHPGGDPRSIQFCHDIGLDYVSCSPFRVPIARIAAAQANVGSE